MRACLDKDGLKYYDSHIKNYITNKTKIYEHTFTVNDWTQMVRTSTYYIDILFSDHKISDPYLAICCNNTGSPVIVDVLICADKKIRIKSEQTFDGFLIINQK